MKSRILRKEKNNLMKISKNIAKNKKILWNSYKQEYQRSKEN